MRISTKITDRQGWEQIRARGFSHWIFWRGIVGFALPMMVMGLLIAFYSATPEAAPWWIIILAVVVLSLDGGYIVADWAWHKHEKTFGGPPSQA